VPGLLLIAPGTSVLLYGLANAGTSAGFGRPDVTMPLMVAAYVGLDKEQIPHSSVLTRSAQQIGGSFGTAVLAVILEGAIAAHHGALADAFHVAFWWSAGFSAVAVLLSLWLPGAQRTPPAEAARRSASDSTSGSSLVSPMPPADRGPTATSPPGHGLRQNTTHVVKRGLKTGTLALAAHPSTAYRA
jgi:hypothetical protein